jgi:hypothetical protein
LFDVQPYVVHEALLEDTRGGGPRAGEGAVVATSEGELLMIYGRFEGPKDEDHATLVSRRSRDGGRTWSDPLTFATTPQGALNVMSVSLLALQDGRIGCVYLLKRSTSDCRPWFTASRDGGRSWSPAVAMAPQVAYYTVNNDRLVQLRSGRLLAPYALYRGEPGHGECGCFVSDDAGATWKIAPCIAIDKTRITKPRMIDEKYPAGAEVYRTGDVHAQEPGVIELLDGRVLMWARTTGGYCYRALSSDGGWSWAPFEAITEFSMCCSPQSMARLPASKRIVMLFNDREGLAYASPEFFRRAPLSIAVSDDDARTWRRHGLLEPADIPSNCYYSICFLGDLAVFTYYEGVRESEADGRPAIRNLASLKLKIIRRAYLEL